MTGKEQAICFLKQYIKAKNIAPWVAEYAEHRARSTLNYLGGIAGSWRTDYSECNYFYPVLVNGELVDFSNVEKVRQFYERVKQ